MTNTWCEVLGIEVPSLESVSNHRDAITYSLLIVALLERGGPMTLSEVAARFEQADVAHAQRALLSLKRCRPDRAPIYRDGDQYHLDPYDDELDLWVFRLGLRPPKMPSLKLVRPDSAPLHGPEVSLTVGELEEAFKETSLRNWSAQRLALAVLDANGGPMRPQEVVEFVATRTRGRSLTKGSGQFGRKGSAVEVMSDGKWSVAAEAGQALLSARRAVRDRVELIRRYAAIQARPRVVESERVAHAAEPAEMSCALLYVFPSKNPKAVALLDVGRRELATFIEGEIRTVRERLDAFDMIGAIEVRSLLRALDIDPGWRRLAELGPSQKTTRLNSSGRTLKITTDLLIQGSCGISRPFGDEKKLAMYLKDGQHTKLRRRLESDVKSLHALYQYGRLQGAVRLRWGFLDEFIPAPWVHRDEPGLHDLKKAAIEADASLEVVLGSAPGWEDPWARVRPAFVEPDERGWGTRLVDEHGHGIDENEVQLARFRGLC